MDNTTVSIPQTVLPRAPLCWRQGEVFCEQTSMGSAEHHTLLLETFTSLCTLRALRNSTITEACSILFSWDFSKPISAWPTYSFVQHSYNLPQNTKWGTLFHITSGFQRSDTTGRTARHYWAGHLTASYLCATSSLCTQVIR